MVLATKSQGVYDSQIKRREYFCHARAEICYRGEITYPPLPFNCTLRSSNPIFITIIQVLDHDDSYLVYDLVNLENGCHSGV